ncbi:MAG: 4Fe-4S dicluster domain-containing protein [Anaerolineae bacterium]|nr:4Fe-4S dicluster domain-containing protein [Anaerolineae bacterium]
MLCDLTRCIGCGYCQRACCEWNQLNPSEASATAKELDCGLSAELWTFPELREIEEDGKQFRVFVKRQCMHCLEPACVSACPVGALSRLENGAVTYDESKCIGCRYCMVACPYSVPKFEWDERLPRIRKCTFCADRQAQGMEPACSAACPTGTLTFGKRDELIAEAKARIQADPANYVSHIYGQDELGGSSWLYLSPVPFEKLGFPEFKTEPVTGLSEAVATYGTAGVAASVAAMLGGFYWLNHRKSEPELQEPASKGEGAEQ